MSVAPFVFEVAVVFFATLITLNYYGTLRKKHFLVSFAVFISWFFSFLIIFILPMDVTNTCYQDCLKRFVVKKINDSGNSTVTPPSHKCEEPWSYMPSNVLPDLWRVIYWSSQLLSWILLPIMQSYVYAGDFSVWGKFKTAMFENAIWYGSYLIIFGGLLIYVALKPELNLNTESLKLIGITASNTWGLLLLVLLLGYGLVDLPRKLWNMTLSTFRHENALFKVAKLSTEKEDADEELATLLNEVKKASEEIKYNSELRKYLDVIIDKCPGGSTSLFSKGTDDYVDYSHTEGKMNFTEKGLVKLHKNVIVMSQRAVRTQFQWNEALKLAFYLEDVIKAETSKDSIFKSSFSEHNPKSRLSMKMRWYWEMMFKPIILKFSSIILALFSVCLVWSEVTFFSSSPTLSLFALLIDKTKQDYMFFSLEVVLCVTIAYMCACTYYTVFKMKFFNYYYFAAHQTDSNSLLFSGLLLCRLTYALCLNFLAMIHMDGHITGQTSDRAFSETDFTRFMGHMDLLSFISKGFNVYYPMTVVLVCFCTYFNFGKRLLHCFGVEQFITDDDFSADLIREGREICKREKRKLEREINGKDWSERSKNLRNKYTKFGTSRKTDHQRIDDSGDDDMIDPGTKNNPKTNLGAAGRKKYTKDDKIDLLDDVEYAPPSAPRLAPSSRGYDHIGGSVNTSVPRNIFDDA